MALIALYVLFGFFTVPPIVSAVAKSQVEKNLNANLELESVSFNPLTLRLTLEGVSLKDLQDEEVLRLGNGQFALSLSSIRHLAPVLKEVLLDEPAIFLARDSEGAINVLHLLKEMPEKESTEESPSTELPKIAIQRFAITDGKIELKDESLQAPVSLSFSPITFDLNDFSTFDEEGNQLRFAATSTSGGSAKGSGSFSLDPIAATAELELTNFDIAAFAAYIREFVDVDLRQGEVDLALTVNLKADSEEEMIAGNLQSLALSNLTLFLAEAEDPFFTLGEVKIANAEFAAWDPRLTVESITVSDGNARVQRLEDGSIDLLALIPPTEDSNTEETATEKAADPLALSFLVEKFDINRFDFSVLDFSTGESAELDGHLENIAFQSITEDLNQPIPFQINGSLLEEAQFHFAGNVVPQTLAGEVELAIDSIPLIRFNPWIPLFTDLSLHSGTAGVEGKIELVEGNDDLPVVYFTGKSEIKNLELREEESPVLGFNNLLLDGLHLQSEPLSIQGTLIQLDGPHAVLVLEEDGNLNILRLLRMTEPGEIAESADSPNELPPTSEESPAETADFPLTYEFDAIEIKQGDIKVSDETVVPAYATQLNQLDIEIAGLASDPTSRASINLSGNLPNASRVHITGFANTQPEDLYVDLKIALAGFSLPPASSYSGPIIGRTISQGRLDFNTTAKVENDNLSAQNIILLKDFRLGDRVESDAPNLPLDLALGLLRNRNGEISLEIPLSGQLTDPQFSITAVATNALFSVIRNIASSPFSVLGNLVG
ncbi:MAG TPA: DUF748 domain-containing protein, partial [Opitutales bacterium]|nr:DUF748 domain-containing protein [Opitutales bacterium]